MPSKSMQRTTTQADHEPQTPSASPTERSAACEYYRSPTNLFYGFVGEDEMCPKLAKSESFYQTLNESKSEFRLFLVSLATDIEDPLECWMFTASLDSAPPFTALSYMWGDNNDRSSLSVNGISLSVPVNLVAAIKQIRDAVPSMILKAYLRVVSQHPHGKFGYCIWADSVCINQASNEEKSYQVPLMGRIYSQAFQVISYLGEEMELENLALAFQTFETVHFEVHRRESDDTDDTAKNLAELAWIQKYPWLLEVD